MKKIAYKIPKVFLAALILGLAGCVGSRPAVRVAQYSKYQQKQAGFSPQQQSWIEKNCPFGMPKTAKDWNHGPTQYAIREGYVLQHSDVDKVPLWVCEHVSEDQLEGTATRDSGRFLADHLLKAGTRAELPDYARSGYDRGHQAPAGDQNKDQRLKDETFFLSNMAPQLPDLNRKIWKNLEERARDWISDRGEGYIITGGLFYDSREDDPSTASGTVNYRTIGPGAVSVPTHFYKIIVAKDGVDKWQAIGFVMENRGYPAPYKFEEYLRSIDWIEQHTGLDFMPDLDPLEEKRLERAASPIWN